MSNLPDSTLPPAYSDLAPDTTFDADPKPPPDPTIEQLERREARRRFERQSLFLPMGIIAFLWIVVTIGMIWLSLGGKWFGLDTNQEFYRTLFNGVANVVVMIITCVWMLLLAIPIGLTVYLWSYRRQQIAARPPGPKPLPFFWRIDNLIIQIRETIARILPMLARPVVLAYGLAAYVKTLFIEIKKILHLE